MTLNDIQNLSELASESQWSVSVLAIKWGGSVRTLHQHFLKHMGKPQYSALELLGDGSSIKETTPCLGYKPRSNFTRQYKRQCGIRPGKRSCLIN